MPTKIPWAEETWSPMTGCTPASDGCLNCYARRMAGRMRGRFGYPADDPFRPTFHPNRLAQPLLWTRPRSIFVCSMSDLFHPQFPDHYRDDVFDAMLASEQNCDPDGVPLDPHTWIILTKRASMMLGYFESTGYRAEYLEKIERLWIGVSAENQETWDERVEILGWIPAENKLVSIEPMLGRIEVGPLLTAAGIKQIIVGCETGPGRRPMPWDWACDVVLRCDAAGVPRFAKQMARKNEDGTGPIERPHPMPGEIAWAW